MDIRISRNYQTGRAYVQSETPKGAAWIDENIIAPENPQTTVTITIDTADELADDIRHAGLDVEII